MATIRFLLPESLNCSKCGIELDLNVNERKSGKYKCPKCGYSYNLENISDKEKISILLERVNLLEEQLSSSKIYSLNFWNRAWAIFGHQLAAGVTIYLALLLLILLLIK